ncbi:MAG: sulfotransferase, partial [Thiolinea sp.]
MGTVSPGIKIIGAGMPRTGTMSLKIALEQLGYAQCYHMVDLMQNLSHVPDWLAVSRGETIDWDTILTGYQAIVDIPGQRYYQELMQAYPDAKVILSTRNPARWYDSVQQTIYQTHQLNEVETTWWWLRYPLSERRKNKALLGGLIGRILWDDYFAQRFEDKDYVLSVYENHLKAVRAHVPAEQLLEFDVAEGWQPLCDFLDVPVPPQEAFPHVNDREQFREFWEIKEAKPLTSQTAITTLAQQVEQHSVTSPGATSLIYQNNAISYRELQARSQQVAHLLHQHGVTTGSPIAILLPNCPEFVISYLAIQQLSGVSITINTALTQAEISHILDDSQAELLITTTPLQQSIVQENH